MPDTLTRRHLSADTHHCDFSSMVFTDKILYFCYNTNEAMAAGGWWLIPRSVVEGSNNWDEKR